MSWLTVAQANESANQWWAAGPFVVALAVVAVLSLIVAVWALRIGYRPRPIPRRIRYRVESISLVDPLLRGTGVRVLDDAGKTLDRVTATTVDIVNSGRSGIRGADVLPGRRGFPDALVLDVAAGAPLTVVRTEIDDDHQSHIDPRIEEISVDGEPFWKLDFNVLGPGDGFRVALLHDGAEVERLELVGHLLDGEIIQGSAAGRAEFFGLVASDIKRVTISIPFLGSITYGTDHD